MSEPVRINRLHFVNCYLVPEDDGLTLIDTTLPRGARKIMAAAEELGQPIARIVLTHAHGDHIGSTDELKAALGEVELIIGERDARLLAKDWTPDPGEPEGKPRGYFSGIRSRPTRTVREGDQIGSLRVIDTPGHTPGHIALLDGRDGTLFCGDTYVTLGGVATSARMNPRFPLPAMGTWNRPRTLESARRLRALEPRRLAPGHGAIVDSPLAAMDAAIARAS